MELSIKQNRSLDVIGIGRLCIDLNANEIHRPLEETLTFTKYVGGSPANITIALSRLGAKTGFYRKRVGSEIPGYTDIQSMSRTATSKGIEKN